MSGQPVMFNEDRRGSKRVADEDRPERSVSIQSSASIIPGASLSPKKQRLSDFSPRFTHLSLAIWLG